MKELVDKYIDSEDVKFPYYGKSGITVDGFVVFCAVCGEPTVELRGKVMDYPKCIEFEIAGCCYDCKCITWGNKTRWYDDGHTLTMTENGWEEGMMVKKDDGIPWSPLRIFAMIMILASIFMLMSKCA